METLSEDNRLPGLDSNRGSREYNSQALPLHHSGRLKRFPVKSTVLWDVTPCSRVEVVRTAHHGR